MHDVTNYYGPAKPEWSPHAWHEFQTGRSTVQKNGVVLIDGVLGKLGCDTLIADFDNQQTHPVGVNGYANDLEHVGSHRAQAWSVPIAEAITPVMHFHLPLGFRAQNGRLIAGGLQPRWDVPAPSTIFMPEDGIRGYRFLASTPWLRFMRYDQGGKHVPHYDAPYYNPFEGYITLFSWVLYLRTLEEDAGGGFEFVNDGNGGVPMRDRPKEAFADWQEMAPRDKITQTIHPVAGRLLIFPHWLCHQVQDFTGPGSRYIIRGDVAYRIIEK